MELSFTQSLWLKIQESSLSSCSFYTIKSNSNTFHSTFKIYFQNSNNFPESRLGFFFLIQDPIIPHLYNCNNPHMYLLPLDSFLTILESIPNQDYKFLHDLALPVFMISSPVIPSLFLSTNIPLPVVHQTHTLISTSGHLHLLFPLPRMLFYQISWLILSFHWCFSKMLSP